MNLGQENIVCTGNWKDEVYPSPRTFCWELCPFNPLLALFMWKGGCVCVLRRTGFVPSTHRKAGVLGSEPGCRAPWDCADLATGCQGAVPPEADGPFGNVSLFLGN